MSQLKIYIIIFSLQVKLQVMKHHEIFAQQHIPLHKMMHQWRGYQCILNRGMVQGTQQNKEQKLLDILCQPWKEEYGHLLSEYILVAQIELMYFTLWAPNNRSPNGCFLSTYFCPLSVWIRKVGLDSPWLEKRTFFPSYIIHEILHWLTWIAEP